MAPLAFEEVVPGAEVVPEVAALLVVPVAVVPPGVVVVAAWVAGADVVVTTAVVVAAPVPDPDPDPVEEAPPELEGFFPTQLVSEPGRTLKGAES